MIDSPEVRWCVCPLFFRGVTWTSFRSFSEMIVPTPNGKGTELKNNRQNTSKMPLQRGQNGALLKIFHRRPQIMKFCACKRKLLAFRRLSRFSAICAISKRRKAAFWAQNVMFCSVVRASRGRDMAAVIMRRRPRCNAVRPSPQPRKALTASPSRLSGKTAELPLSVNRYE